MEITDTHATFTVHINGESTMQTYMGEFKVKCLLSPYDQIQADKMYRELLGDQLLYASDNAKTHAFALSQLKYRIIEFAPFFANPNQPSVPGGHLQDGNVLFEVLNKAIEAQEKYMEQTQEQAEKMEQRLKEAIQNKSLKREEEKIEEEEEIVDEI